MKCHLCGAPLPPAPLHQGHPRKWCSSACQSKAWRQAHAKQHSLDCQGCGTPLEQQGGRRGALFKYHRECQMVRRTWHRLEQDTARMARYHALKAAGAYPEVAKYGSAGGGKVSGRHGGAEGGAVMVRIKSANEVRTGEFVRLGGQWRGPVDWVEANPLCDSLLVHYPSGSYELNYPATLVQVSNERPSNG